MKCHMNSKRDKKTMPPARSEVCSATDPPDTSPTPLDLNFASFSYEDWLTRKQKDLGRCRRYKIGVAYQSLNVYGFGTATDYQKTVLNYLLVYYHRSLQLFGRKLKSKIDILREFEGIVRNGEMLLVLGKPGSGCTTLLKTLAGQNNGSFIDSGSVLNYQGMCCIWLRSCGPFSQVCLHFSYHQAVATTKRR